MFTFYIFLAPVVACVLIILNFLISTSNSYIEKDGPFECGFTSYQQSRSAFSVAFILVAILFLPFDLEISSILPYVVSAYLNSIYGLVILILFLSTLVMAFVYEINLGALNLDRKHLFNSKELKIKLFKYENTIRSSLNYSVFSKINSYRYYSTFNKAKKKSNIIWSELTSKNIRDDKIWLYKNLAKNQVYIC